MFIILKKFIFGAELEIAKTTHRAFAGWVKHYKCFASLDAEIGRNAFRDVHRKLGISRPAFVRCDDA